ncbi:MAG: GNAT family N-acetyltransferase [Clostridia bacterium]|nr:GNAT family N-acetyltransferase [Clostridia bacterium]
MNMTHTNITHTNIPHTNITHTTILSRKEQEDIHRITALCRLADGLSLSCPEGGDEYWILEEDTTAAAFLAVYKTEETMWECYAFTHPDFRRKGYFSMLLEQVCRYSEAQGEPELCFVTDNKCPAATAVLRELEAELWNEEYMMEYDVTAAGTAFEGGTSASQDALPDMGLDLDIHTTPEGLLICARTPGDSSSADGNGVTAAYRNDDTPMDGNGTSTPDTNPGTDNIPGACVTCHLSLNGTSAYLYSLETVPALRRRGLAGRFLVQLIRHLERKGIQRIYLQVSGSNKPALGLYRKTGFRITETLSYYLY